jgi:hypothetical protein
MRPSASRHARSPFSKLKRAVRDRASRSRTSSWAHSASGQPRRVVRVGPNERASPRTSKGAATRLHPVQPRISPSELEKRIHPPPGARGVESSCASGRSAPDEISGAARSPQVRSTAAAKPTTGESPGRGPSRRAEAPSPRAEAPSPRAEAPSPRTDTSSPEADPAGSGSRAPPPVLTAPSPNAPEGGEGDASHPPSRPTTMTNSPPDRGFAHESRGCERPLRGGTPPAFGGNVGRSLMGARRLDMRFGTPCELRGSKGLPLTS